MGCKTEKKRIQRLARNETKARKGTSPTWETGDGGTRMILNPFGGLHG